MYEGKRGFVMLKQSFENPVISVVIPVFNEEEVLDELHKRLTKLHKTFPDYEIIFVNDGSTDKSLIKLKRLCKRDSHCRIVDFSRNFGHQVAVLAGLHHASGQAVVVMDADLQDPPELIPEMVRKWRDGYEVVYGQRRRRKGESIMKRWTAACFYRIMRKLSAIDIPLDTGDFRLLDRKVVDEICRLNDQNPFLRGIVSWLGFKQTPVLYERQPRLAGQSKYSFRKMFELAWHAFVGFSRFPLTLSLFLGMLVLLAFFFYLGLILVKTLTQQPWPVHATIILLVLGLSGIQLMILGIMGQYISRIVNQSQNRPLYVVRERYGFDKIKLPPIRTVGLEPVTEAVSVENT